ncbi:redoxin domain-containing protein [Cellulosimicrobium cellulans]|uniref:redoxin domain-containing protein n=2 Tax=Cellulosimicrobium cellulans TaxID=1710 RepID=UPI0012FD4AAC|nr:redoxin domain-containing protein [Cellulosimicrobium cellulans]
MPVLTAAVVVLTVLVLLNLALTGAVIRRLRADAGPSADGSPRPLVDLAVGASVPAFDATGTEGETLTTADLDGGRTLLAFSSTTCAACVEHAPALAAAADGLAAAGVAVVPVLLGDADPQGLAPVLGAAGPLVREPHGGPVSAAFGVRGTPSYVLVGPDARVLAAGGVLADVVAPVAVVR